MNNVKCVYTHQAPSNRCAIDWYLPVGLGLGKEDGIPEVPRCSVEVPGAEEKLSSVKAERQSHSRNANKTDYLLGLLHMGLELRFPLELGQRRE